MKHCVSCKKELLWDWEEYGHISAPKCLNCWLTEGDWGHEVDYGEDDRLNNLMSKAREVLGKVRICPLCKGERTRLNYRQEIVECYRCHGIEIEPESRLDNDGVDGNGRFPATRPQQAAEEKTRCTKKQQQGIREPIGCKPR